MKTVENIEQSLRDLTPSMKLEVLKERIHQEKNKKTRKLLLALEKKTEREQAAIEDSIKHLEHIRKTPEKGEEERLETLVEEEAVKHPQKTTPLSLYGVETKEVDRLYTREEPKGPIYSSREEKKKDYQPLDRFTSEEGQNLINSEHRSLEKQRKKYETGK